MAGLLPFSISRRERPWLALGTLLSALLVVGVAFHWSAFAFSWPEVFGFISGALCVYLTVKQHIWNFPVGLVNNLLFGVLFLRSRLFADMTLQVVYFILGVLGWVWWKGEIPIATAESSATPAPPIGAPITASSADPREVPGATTTLQELPVRSADAKTLGVLLALTMLGTAGMYAHLVRVNDSAPFWDALTTALSLAAQYLLSRKLLENWFFWIAADLVYVPLYLERRLYLTAILYALFLALCLAGWREWQRALHTSRHPGAI